MKMINLDGKILRNLEEQVLNNQQQIEALKMLGMPGVKISGIVDDISELPSPANDGDLYALRATLNEYDLYLYYDGAWENLGQFPKPGPQGSSGLTGATGPKGDSSTWYAGSSFPTSTLRAGDMFLNILTCQVYRYNGTQWISQTNIKGAAGNDGQNGNSILSIDAQHQTDKTKITINTTAGGVIVFNIPDGKPGAGFHIAHIYPDDVAGSPTLTTLPVDIEDTIEEEWPAATSDPSEAVLVKTTQDGDFIFVIIVENGVNKWDNVGQIQSVQGPAGDPGDRIMDSECIVKQAAGDQYPNTYKLFIDYLDTAPVADNTDPGIKIVVLDEEPATYYDGYYYIITEE